MVSNLEHGVRRVSLRVRFVWQDAWLGLYVGPKENAARLYAPGDFTEPRVYLYKERKTYVCIIPFLPLIISWRSV